MALEQTKYAHGRYHEDIDISAVDYSALTNGRSQPIPFQINVDDGVKLSVKLVDSLVFEDMYFNPGDNPAQVIAVEAALTSVDIKAVYPFKPATTSINTTD